MITYDVRLLVRDGQPPSVVLEQLLTGVLRVHAVVLLVPDPGAPADRPTPASPVHRNPRSYAHYEQVRDWVGQRVRPARYRADRPHPEEYA